VGELPAGEERAAAGGGAEADHLSVVRRPRLRAGSYCYQLRSHRASLGADRAHQVRLADRQRWSIPNKSDQLSVS